MAVFWALWDQSGGEWVLQAQKMDRHMNLFGWKFELLSSQIQAVNAVMILALIPTFQYLLYPAMNAVWRLTPLRKIGLGIFTVGVAFLSPPGSRRASGPATRSTCSGSCRPTCCSPPARS